jgi:hypothetical protein
MTGILIQMISPLLAHPRPGVSGCDDRLALARRRRRSVLAVAGVLTSVCVASACQQSDDAVSATSTSSTPAGSASRPLTPAFGTVGTELGAACTYTDPGATPISVGRALTCPDGTRVWVDGVLIIDADGTRSICDEEAATSPASCADNGLRIIGPGLTSPPLIGVKSGSTLTLQPEPFSVTIPVSTAPPTT